MSILVVGVISALIALGVQYTTIAKKMSGSRKVMENLENELTYMKDSYEKVQNYFDQMIDVGSLREKSVELRAVQESLKAERGRITITQAELETVESRLRELEEIERELEASSVETREELNILKTKEEELKAKNNKISEQIVNTSSEIDRVLGTIRMSAELENHISQAKQELVKSQQQIEVLMLQIEEGNAQYCSLKKRYDALDIEYAQLYEKFSESGE